jgi:nicotinate-nucleotide adenylyltransferase
MPVPQPLRVGVLGGSFDPPHHMHVALARAAAQQLQLDVLHIIPTGQAWHKPRALSDGEHRAAMSRLAFAEVRGALVDEREMLRRGPSYTIDTLLDLKAQYPQAQLFLVLGEDQLRAFHTWKRAEEIMRAAIICVAERDACASEQMQKIPEFPGLQRLQIPAQDLSATAVREALARGEPVNHLVPESVARYIAHHHLYQPS